LAAVLSSAVITSAIAVGSGSAVAGQPGPTTTPPKSTKGLPTPSVPPKAVDGIQPADIEAFAKAVNIPLDDAKAAFDDVKPLLDFQEAHKTDPEFGSVRLTYDGGKYVPRMRLTNPKSALAQTVKVRVPLQVTIAGYSYAELRTLLTQANALALTVGGTETGINEDRGVVFIKTDRDLSKVQVPAGVEVLRSPASEIIRETYPGAPTEAGNGTQKCTVGFPVERISDGFAGIVTAGHCSNDYWTPSWGRQIDVQNATNATFSENIPYNWASSYAWPSEQDTCSPYDKQVNPVSLQNAYSIFRNNSTGQWASIYHSAGGFVTGQPIYRVGRRTSQSGQLLTTSSAAVISPATGDCPQGQVLGIQYSSPSSEGGDSGGPVMVSYGGQWYAAGIHIGKKTGAFGFFVAHWDAVPTGWRMCTVYQTCYP
jgi:hypothetical protein